MGQRVVQLSNSVAFNAERFSQKRKGRLFLGRGVGNMPAVLLDVEVVFLG